MEPQMSCLPFIPFDFEIEKVRLLRNITPNEFFILKLSTSFKHPPSIKRPPVKTKYLPYCCSKKGLSESESLVFAPHC